MRKLYATAALCATLALIAPSAFGPSFAGATETPEKSVPQGEDPPGVDDGQQLPAPKDKEVIPPPPVGDEDIYTDAPNPHAGHEEEVLPRPAPEEAPSLTPH